MRSEPALTYSPRLHCRQPISSPVREDVPNGTVRQAHEACEEGVVRHGPTAHDEAPQAEEIPVATRQSTAGSAICAGQRSASCRSKSPQTVEWRRRQFLLTTPSHLRRHRVPRGATPFSPMPHWMQRPYIFASTRPQNPHNHIRIHRARRSAAASCPNYLLANGAGLVSQAAGHNLSL